MTRFTALSLVVALGAACGSQVKQSNNSQTGQQITYTPEGCDYKVTTPEGAVEADYLSKTTPSTTAPAHVHASYAGNASTSFAVNWKSEPGAYLTQILYGTDRAAVEAATAAGGSVKLQQGHSIRFTSLSDVPDEHDVVQGTLVHEAHVCGLSPATTYYYKVGNSGAFSTVYALTTAPAPGSTAPFRFAVTGDSRNETAIWAKAQKALLDKGAVFQLFSGDAVAIGSIQTQWDSFFETKEGDVMASDVMATIPIMMANGNHDAMAVNLTAQFAMPQVEGGGETPSGKDWFSFDYGNAHFLFLNDTTSSGSTISGKERTWAQQDLAKVDRTKTPWVFAVHHQPTYSCSPTHGSDTALRAAWGPVFDDGKVDIVFNGHVHNYERSKPMRNDQVASSLTAGTTYVVAAGVGAGLYDINNTCPHTETTQKTQNYVIVDIADKTLTFKAYDLNTNSVIDQFTITK